MSVFQILKNNVLIIDGNQQYSDTVDNFLLDAGAVSVPESVILSLIHISEPTRPY